MCGYFFGHHRHKEEASTKHSDRASPPWRQLRKLAYQTAP